MRFLNLHRLSSFRQFSSASDLLKDALVDSSRRDQQNHRIKVDPNETSIVLFPGQGSQYVGMGQNLLKFPGARDIFELANEVLKYDLLKICLEGPTSTLNKTIHCQPAVMVISLAALEKLKEERPNVIDNCAATSGFSLGEITALVFAGAIPFDKALRLVQTRAEAMQAACESVEGGMLTIMYAPDAEVGLACKKAQQWCLDKGIESPECIVSNYLFPHCKVIGGSLEALKFIESNANHFGIKRTKRIPVNGAFHTAHMEQAVDVFRKALNRIEIEDPMISVHSNVDGKRYRNAEHIRKQLPKQIVKPVKWEQTLHMMYERKQGEHFPRTFECGPGKGLTTILKQVNAKAHSNSFNVEA